MLSRNLFTIIQTMPHLRLGISSCLAGKRVRYDGRHKIVSDLIQELQEQVELVSICPEVAIGLGVPRPPIRLSGSLSHPVARRIDDPGFVVTKDLHDFANQVALEFDLDGYIFKSRSPSCGLNSAPVYINSQLQKETISGIYSQTLTSCLPGLPIIEKSASTSHSNYHAFLEKCGEYHKLRTWLDGSISTQHTSP